MNPIGTMRGTTGSTFTLAGIFPAGKVGYRSIGGGEYRVRVEPADGAPAFPLNGWKTPGQDGQNRYSTVVSQDSLVRAVATASGILSAASLN